MNHRPDSPRVLPSLRSPAGAFSLVEILIASLVLVGALVPMYILFTGSSVSVFRSRISYMALHAAREELEALRQVPPSKLPKMRHDWEPVTGTVLRKCVPNVDDSGAVTVPTTGAGSAIEYPPEYARIQTKVGVSSIDDQDPDPEVGVPAHPRLFRVMLQVRWQEMGESTEEGGAGHRTALSRFRTVIGNHRVR